MPWTSLISGKDLIFYGTTGEPGVFPAFLHAHRHQTVILKLSIVELLKDYMIVSEQCWKGCLTNEELTLSDFHLFDEDIPGVGLILRKSSIPHEMKCTKFSSKRRVGLNLQGH